MKKYIVLIFAILIFGFSSLLIYYFNYNDNVKNKYTNISDNNKINEIDESIKNEEKDSTAEYYKYSNEELNKEESKSKEEIDKIYKNVMAKINLFAVSMNYDEMSKLALEVLDNETIIDGNIYSNLTAISLLKGFEEFDSESKIEILGTIKEPSVYFSVFYGLEPEYQSFILNSEEFLFVPINDSNKAELLSIKNEWDLNSKANEYFSDVSDLNIYNLEISVSGVIYNIYISGRDDYYYRITNITSNSANKTSYLDYYNLWGKKEIDIRYD